MCEIYERQSRRPERVTMEADDMRLPDTEPPIDRKNVAGSDRAAGSRSEAGPKLLDSLDKLAEDGPAAQAKRKRPARIFANVRYYGRPPEVSTAVAVSRYDLKHGTTLLLPDIPVWERAAWPQE